MNYLYLGLLSLSLAVIEYLAGGASLLFDLPSCALLSLLAVLTLCSFRRSQPRADLSCLLGSAIFFGYVLARILASPVEYLTRHDLFSVLGALIAYLLVAFYLTNPKPRLWLVFVLLVLGLVNAGIGALQYFRPALLAPFSLGPAPEYAARAAGFYGCPDHLAGFFEAVGLLGLSVACWGRGRHWVKVLTGYLALMCLGGVALTGSRGGGLSAAFGLSVFIGLSLFVLRKGVIVHKWVLLGCTLLAAGLLVGGMVYFMSHQVTLRLRWAGLRYEGNSRLEMWAAAVQQFKINPVFGTGSGTYLYYQRHFRGSFEFADAIYAHNDYLQLLAEFGIMGLAGCLFFLAAHFRHGLRVLRWFLAERLADLGRIRSDTLALNIGALSALSAYLVHSMFDFNLHIPANALVVAVAFGILANPGVETPFGWEHQARVNFWARLALPALGIWLGLAGLPTLPAEYFARESRAAVRRAQQVSERTAGSAERAIADTVRRERYAAGAKLAYKGIAYDKSNPYLYCYFGEASFGLGQVAPTSLAAQFSYKTAAQAYSNGLALFPQDRYLLLGMGWSLDALKHFDEAEPYFKKVVDWEPNSAQIHAYYGNHLRAARRWEQAEAEYNYALKLDGSFAAKVGLERLAEDRAAALTAPAGTNQAVPPPQR